jgi:hypothetical protein
MGLKDSSKTRVRPIFNELLDRSRSGADWLDALSQMASRSRPAAASFGQLGHLIPSDTPATRDDRLGRVFERTVAPPAEFLKWLLEHPDQLQIPDRATFGASSPNAQDWRRKLFSDDPVLRAQAIAEGTGALTVEGAEGSRHQWWAFEGFTHIDCCLITDSTVLFVEGKRTEAVSPSTRWFVKRSQIWRNVETAQQFARGKEFGVILAVEDDEAGKTALAGADATLRDSYPHLSESGRAALASHLLGFITWPETVARFSLPPRCLPNTTDDLM